jgi:hypothetical protein
MSAAHQYHRVRFADGRALDDWAADVIHLAVRPLGLRSAGAGPRPVVFIPLQPPPDGVIYGYVSDDACRLADGLAPRVELDGTLVSLRELPEGLTLLYGEGGDADAYEGRAVR